MGSDETVVLPHHLLLLLFLPHPPAVVLLLLVPSCGWRMARGDKRQFRISHRHLPDRSHNQWTRFVVGHESREQRIGGVL